MVRGIRPEPPGAAVDITESLIERLVHRFYAQVRADEMLGPIFNDAIHDWDAHLAKLCDFWSSVMLMSGRYKGAPMQVHAALPEITASHFDHWLGLFQATAEQVCPPEAAALFIDRSRRIAKSLELGIATQRGQLLKVGERLQA